MEKIIEQLYITTCGRIFNKRSSRRTIKSFEIIPSLKDTFTRFIKNNNLKEEDFVRSKIVGRNSSNKPLYYYKYNVETPLYNELHGTIDSYGYKIFTIDKNNYKWHRAILTIFRLY